LPGNMEVGLMELAMQPEQIKKVYQSKVAKACAHDKYYIRSGQSGVLWGTDLACQSGPMISPQMYRDLFLDGFKHRISSVKAVGQKVVKHMCGNNWQLLDMMVEAGIDCYQSIQASAGMDIVEVHKKYSDKFVCWGGVNVENLIGGTMQDVRKDVRRVMTEISPQGRFIFGTSHSVAVGTKYDNFMAMLDEVNRFL
jgi:uroporphyrinogen-III decarboxylase